ncbi:MAG: IS630 family transposase [Acidimicrobiales bacterium]
MRKRSRVKRRGLEEKRAQVVRLIEAGTHPEVVAAAFEVGRSTVYGWLAAYRARGEESLKVGKSTGRPPKLSLRQVAKLRALIVGKDPRQLHFDFALWTRDMVRTLVNERFGVEMSRQGVSNMLRRMGLSPQRPLVRAYEQDPEAVERWKTEEYPRIAAEAKAKRAQIFFCDEAGVRTDHHAGTTWGEVGKTPIVRGTGQRRSLNMISAVSAKGKLHFSFCGRINSESFIEYLKALLHDVPGKIYLILDGHSAHKSAKTRAFAASTKGRLSLFYLPPYSPELNPDEWVWHNIKHDRVGKMAARSLEEMKAGIEKAVERLRTSREIVLGFFRSPDLAYIKV